ncbi:MAG: hypothetical protein GY865_13040 [candidate division Zixibacteria bacterium]|nr:hypothetical protein [candidate division Zixibacteria bacterium]
MRPKLRFLSDELIERIISEARDLLCGLGIAVQNDNAVKLLTDNGAKFDNSKNRVCYTPDIIDKTLKSTPSSFKLYNSFGKEAIDLSGFNVNFTPGSSAINILDNKTGQTHQPITDDYIQFAQLMSQMNFINSQSTCMVPSDVDSKISDSYRLYLSLLFCEKPIVTGAFSIEGFEIMKNLQLVIRGTKEKLAEKPLTVFSACPTSPLKWGNVSSQNVIDCAQYFIPIEIVPMPLTGFMAPVTLVGTLVQHTAETLAGMAISQLANPGTPILYGGSPAIFDIRYETTPMGAIGTMMIDCSINEIGKYLKIPTQAYISLSDSKLLDAQAGLETSMGATLAALSGINNVSGPGMLDFESVFSLEKLVVDNEICGLVNRMQKGIEPKEDFPSQPRFEEMLRDEHLLISDHTRRYLSEEIHFPGPVIDRANRSRWQEEGSLTIGQRAEAEVKRIISEYEPIGLSEEIKNELTELMLAEAKKYGMSNLPRI